MNYPYNNLENFTLASLLDRSVQLYSHRPFSAFVGDEALNYKAFMQNIEKMVAVLQNSGISKGDKVLLLSENMPNWGVAYFAVTYFGAVIVPVLPDFHPSDIERILIHSEASAVFVSQKHLNKIKDSDRSNVGLVIELDRLQIIDELTNKDLACDEETIKTPITKPDEDEMAAIIYTSGTTGNSKGVMLSHKNIVINAMSAHEKVKVLPSDIFLSILPLAHVFECTVGLIIPILHGSSIYYIDKAPTPSVLMNAFQTVRPTMILTVPLIIEKIYKKKVFEAINNCVIKRNLYKIYFIRKIFNIIAGKKIIKAFGGKIRLFVIGGAPLSPFVEEFLIEANFPYIVGYGLTESSPIIASSAIGDKPRFKSTGKAFSNVELKIINKNSETSEGEICAKSPCVMMGYYKDTDKSDEVIKDGWLMTGDLGYIDKDGFLFISGRSKNVIIGSNGENIYPEQIELIINRHAAVLDSLVLQKNGKITAMINLDYETCNINNKMDIDSFLEDMRKDVNMQLSSFSKIMKFEEHTEEFTKTPTNKIKRHLYGN